MEEYFEQAKGLDPKLPNARLYLRSTYWPEYIPGAANKENPGKGGCPAEEFRGVPIIKQQFISALDGLGSLPFPMAGQSCNPRNIQ
jgi:hypothetical protein